MITPEEIRQKAERQYKGVLRAWLDNDPSFFPKVVPCSKSLDIEDIEAVQRLRNESKEVIGYGYTVQWQTIRSRTIGRNRQIKRILFETRDDLLRLINRQKEFAQFADWQFVLKAGALHRL